MGERALAWGLRLLGIALVIGPLLIALGAHNWDIKAAVLPSDNEMKQIENSVTGIFGGGSPENTFSIGSPTIVGNNVIVPITSHFNIPIKIENLSASVSVPSGKIYVRLENEVEIPVGGTMGVTENLTLSVFGTYTGGLPTNPQLSIDNITFESYGVTVSARNVSGQGGS
jgi:hypothetical protein